MRALSLLTLISFTALAQSNMDLLEKLSKEESYGKAVQTFDKPSKETLTTALYQFDEIKLLPKDVLYFYVPEKLSDLPLSQIGISHRQKGHAPERDYNPGLTSVLVYSKDMPGDELRYWAGHSSGKLGAKFAEYRRSPEMDSLYEWPKVGHKGIRTPRSKELVKPNVVRVQNVGTDNVYFSALYIEGVPPQAEKYETLVFTPKSNFGDPVSMEGRYYGGGQNKRGKFPGALRLNSRGHRWQPALPTNMKVDDEKLFITLPEGATISAVDIMCGDTHPDEVRNKDGGWGSLGNASLSVYVEKISDGSRRYLIQDKNVGPQGVISASDVSNDLFISKDERLVISNKGKRSTAYIMALRIGLNHVN